MNSLLYRVLNTRVAEMMRESSLPSWNNRIAASLRSQSRDSPASTTPQREWSNLSSWMSQRPDFHRQTPPTHNTRAKANQTQRVQCRSRPEGAVRWGVRGLIGTASAQKGIHPPRGASLDDLD